MPRLLLRRLLQALAVVAFATTASFVLVHLAPGAPFAIEDPRVSPEIRAQWMRQFGLDRPLGEQYLLYLRNVARGELGWSFSQHRPVAAALGDAIPRTLLLMGTALVLSLAAGITLGVWQARRRRGALRRLVSGASLVAYAVPEFWMALLVLLTFTRNGALSPYSLRSTTKSLYSKKSASSTLTKRVSSSCERCSFSHILVCAALL